jgi:serine/threonine-protein kinase
MGEMAPGEKGQPDRELFEVHRGGDVSAESVRGQLDRILASPAFSRSERPRRLLKFLVEHVLQGDAAKLNEYLLAIEVFNRRASFDPSSDPIVRVEAGRLRRRLREYYESAGRGDPVLIELPQRTYVPVFRRRQAAAPARVARIPSWIASSGTWRIIAIAIAAGTLAGLAAYWATSAVGRKSPPSASSLSVDRKAAASALSANSRSIVVLPFADISLKHDQEYFCDGLTEELIETLTKVDGVRVVARTTAFHFKGKTDDVRAIGKQLNVGLVLEGSVRKTGNRLRIVAQLINATDGYHLWSRTYDREVRDVFAIQQEIARGIVTTLWSELTGARWRRSLQKYSPSVEAYDLYLKGLYSARQWSTEGLTEAIRDLEQAIATDHQYAPAYAALAEYYSLIGVHAGFPPREVMPKAKAAAERALQLDNSLSNGHASLGLVKAVYEWDWIGAEQEFRSAHELDPSDANVHQMYVMGYLVPTGRLDEALKEIREARDIDPISPRIESVLGMVYYFRREYDLAVEQLRKPLDLDPQFYAARLALGSAHEQKARFADAVAAIQEGRPAWRSGIGRSLLGHTYALMGRRAEAQALLQELVQLSKTRYVSPAYIATIYIGLGEKDRAMEWLEKAYQARSATLAYLKVNPRYDSLRSHPRFTALLRKINLE